MALSASHRLTGRAVVLCGLPVLLAGCSPLQSALHPAGTDASYMATLFWIMSTAGFVIWAIVIGTVIYAVLGKRRPRSEKFADRFIFVGGVVFPTVTLAALLVIGLSLLPSWTEGDRPDLRVQVTAEQFWWRMAYELPDGSRVDTANELHLPVGAVAEFELTSTDVIHSFWIPALGGKMDAIPGRTNRLRLEPTKPGVYRGVCAEFCGASHALMAFPVVVHEPVAYAEWLAAEARPASADGSEAFIAAGCGACHTVRGVSEAGAVGPDLTHLASRSTIAAGILPNTRENLEAWLMTPEHFKPDARMPSFASVGEADIRAIVDYLVTLR
jgi:cytochrome c oxidase subunit 2